MSTQSNDEIRPAFTDEGMRRFTRSWAESIVAILNGDLDGARALAAQTDAISANPANRVERTR